MIFRSILLVCGFWALSQSAMAGCWMQCVAYNPLNGNCVAKTKMCNLGDPGQAAKQIGEDLQKAVHKIEANWKEIYNNRLPKELTNIFDHYPLTIAALVFPGTREYALLAAAFDELSHRAKRRGREAKDLIEHSPDWKAEIINRGLARITLEDGDAVTIYDWETQAESYVTPEYDGAWHNFLDCMRGAANISDGEQCFRSLRKDLASLL